MSLENNNNEVEHVSFPALEIDWDLYGQMLDESDLSDDEKREFIRTIWSIVTTFVDLGFGLHHVQQSCGQDGERPMILEGNERGYGANLAVHLLNPKDNDHVTVHAIDGFLSDDLVAAFAEVEAIAEGTQCRNYLISLSLNPPQQENVAIAAFEDAVADVERKLGLVGQPRAIVFHEKNGRRQARAASTGSRR